MKNFIIGLLILIAVFNMGKANKTDLIYYYLNKDKELTVENVKQAIHDLNIQYPKSSLRLCLNESGNLKSNLAVNYNNIFGMRVAKKRVTLAIGKTKSNYAIYKDWLSSVIDYKLWQGTKRIKGNYGKYLKKRGWL